METIFDTLKRTITPESDVAIMGDDWGLDEPAYNVQVSFDFEYQELIKAGMSSMQTPSRKRTTEIRTIYTYSVSKKVWNNLQDLHIGH